MKLSSAAQSITTSPILTVAAEINVKISQGENVYNLTVGDFNSQIYPIPERLTELTIEAYKQHETNYPGAFGLDPLRHSIIDLLKDYCDIDVKMSEVQVASGSRPLIYSFFKTIVDPGDKVIFPVPSWNNDYYTELHKAQPVIVETTPESNFFPTAESLRPVLKDAVLLSLCSPQNPTGTILNKQQLRDICDLVVEENNRRSSDEKPSPHPRGRRNAISSIRGWWGRESLISMVRIQSKYSIIFPKNCQRTRQTSDDRNCKGKSCQFNWKFRSRTSPRRIDSPS